MLLLTPMVLVFVAELVIATLPTRTQSVQTVGKREEAAHGRRRAELHAGGGGLRGALPVG